MSRQLSHSANHAQNTPKSESTPTQETLFLLSISRDEDDAAALRSDLKRSTLSNYKIQQCTNLDNALQLMRVCGFDLVFLRLDDYKSPQSAVDLLRKSEGDQTIIALATSHLLASPAFVRPEGIDATCRVEDLSPSLVSTLVQSTIEQKKEQQSRLQLEKELRLALDASQLGLWKLEIESGRLILDSTAQKLMNIPEDATTLYLEDAIDHVYSKDRELLKHMIAQSVDKTSDITVNFRLRSDAMPLPKIEFTGQYSENGSGSESHLFGVLKRSNPASEIYERITTANSAIQKALDQRDEAMLAANNELKALAKELRGPQALYKIQPIEEASAPERANNTRINETLEKAESHPIPSTSETELEPSGPVPTTSKLKEAAEKTSSSLGKETDKEPSLEIDKDVAFQNVLQSITRQKEESSQAQEFFPFDFSSNPDTDYTDPDPHSEGFVGAAKRLVEITQKAHGLWVTLSFENHVAIEAEQEKDLLFEILKELLTNVVKHAKASDCIIALFRDEDEWVLQVEDDGTGIENNLVSISSPLNQMGLFRIRTKLALKGGNLDLTPSFPTGLIARARLPVKHARNHNAGQDL